jgi:kynureninase
LTAEYVSAQLKLWATQGVLGHFKPIHDSPIRPWLDIDDYAAEQAAALFGASSQEVAIMGTLTANLHILMASFYLPKDKRTKIILEGKAFPSDHVSRFKLWIDERTGAKVYAVRR